ncbi:MAG: hypothetical protein JSU87_12165 [Gemmatimonadota bacterium]|nr:MAG: hypothetical protein JSU87_12165 [Gemmatimonadota bacterium]
MNSENTTKSTPAETEKFRWTVTLVGVLAGWLLLNVTIYIVDPALEQPGVSILLVSLSVILIGIIVGSQSRGATIREAGLAGAILAILTVLFVVAALQVPVPAVIWLASPVYAGGLGLAGGWVGEMLQGTLEESQVDYPIDWPWVFVAVVVGFTLSAYLVLLGRAILDLTFMNTVVVFASSFFITGWIVGHFSPGVTMVEPAIAAAAMSVLDAGFVALWLRSLPAMQVIIVAFVVCVLLALAGGWLGELTQRRLTTRRRVSD